MIVHPTTATPEVTVPESLGEALARISTDGATPLAGGTWIMRGEAQGEGYAPRYVLVAKLPELNRLEFSGEALIIGAAVTHDRLAAFLRGDDRFGGLHTAARKSANPAVRRMATVGGNLSTENFFAADLNPALLTLNATVTLAGLAGSGGDTRETEIPVADFLEDRTGLLEGRLITHVTVPVPSPTDRVASAHERLTMRRAGDYPMVIVNIAIETDAAGVVTAARVAHGSVEPIAALWPELAERLAGSRLDAERAAEAATELAASLQPRDGVEAAGWYRAQILPALVKRAIGTLERTVQRKAESA